MEYLLVVYAELNNQPTVKEIVVHDNKPEAVAEFHAKLAQYISNLNCAHVLLTIMDKNGNTLRVEHFTR